MKRILLYIAFIALFSVDAYSQRTYCNPMNLDYRFCLWMPSRREAADPTMVVFKNEYYLFASKTGGYWHSKDMKSWDLVKTNDLPLEDYAPTAVVINNEVYFMASGSNIKIFKTSDPQSGRWEVVNDKFPIGLTDPCLFLDDNQRLYLYYGCSNKEPLYAVELDLKNKLNPIGKPIPTIYGNKEEYGWDNAGDYNENPAPTPWVEGCWMNKHNGRYYLQYATPGTQFKSYVDVVYVANAPLGPFTLQKSNPFSYKPEGFIAGAGHSSTFADVLGNYWHVATMTISRIDWFERRLGLFPAGFDKDATMYANTAYGDYPHFYPKGKVTSVNNLFTGWMLLSYGKPVEVSSAIDSFPAKQAVDENVRTFWSAKTGDKGEWLCVDLMKQCDIRALQVNFTEHQAKLLGRSDYGGYQYLVEYSNNRINWHTLLDKTKSSSDLPHDYTELQKPITARYIKLTCYRIPSGTFAISGFRVFGHSKDALPARVKNFTAVRNSADAKSVSLCWKKIPGATGYNIRYGVAKNKLYLNYMVYADTSFTIRSLNRNNAYFFTVDTFNERGITKGKMLIKQ
jgi:Beta-xylosidase